MSRLTLRHVGAPSLTARFSSILFLALWMVSSSAGAAVITPIGLADFADPTVLDFEDRADGPIAADDALFSDFGIVALSATGSDDADIYSEGGGTRALFYSSANGFLLDSSGRPALPEFATTDLTYSLTFDRHLERIGFGTPDHGASILVEFFDGATALGTYTLGGSNSPPSYLASDMLFDRVTISSPNQGLGFGLDNITIEARAVPAPSTLVLLAIALLGVRRMRG